VKLSKVTISGDTLVSQNRTLTLTTATEPANAGDASLNWTSLDPTIATVSTAGVVSGVLNTSRQDDQVVGIVATAVDGGGAADTLYVRVRYTKPTRIDLYGRERIFYTDAPASVAPFTLTPTFLPTDSRTGTSKTDDYTWSTTGDAGVITVAGGTVTLAGGYGKAAATITSFDGIVGNYYIEVKHVADNTYNLFSDFEAAGAEPTWLGVMAGITGGANPNNAFQDFHGTRVTYSYISASAGRNYLTHLKNAIVGDRINLRFDWFLGSNTDGILSIRPDSIGDLNEFGRPKLGSGNQDVTVGVEYFVAEKNILALRWDTRTGVDSFYYFTDDYNNSASNDPGATGWPTGTYLNMAANMGAWYTIDLSVDYLLGRITTLTITETDNPTNTVTVNDIPLNAAMLADANKARTIKAIMVNSVRPGSGTNTTTSAIDNLGYKVTVVTPITLTLNPDGGTFADNSTETKTFTAAAGESIAAFIPAISRANYNFLGWYDGNTLYENQTFAANVTLTAKWEAIVYTVTFVPGEGVAAVAPQTIPHGEKAVQPAVPERECYIFGGWFNGATRWNFATAVVTSDITLTAQWEADPECNKPSAVSADALPGVSLYPNPVSELLNISGLDGSETLTVVDLSGRVLLTQKANAGTTRLSVSTLPQGTYLVKVARGAAVKAVKIVVAK
jgi:uncharacterized repeat protein (TIGR02543 family)